MCSFKTATTAPRHQSCHSIHYRNQPCLAVAAATTTRPSMARLALATIAVAVILALASGTASQPPAANCGASVSSLMVCAPYVHVLPGRYDDADERATQGVLQRSEERNDEPRRSPVPLRRAGHGLFHFGYQLNMTRILALPATCGVDPAAFSRWNSEYLLTDIDLVQ